MQCRWISEMHPPAVKRRSTGAAMEPYQYDKNISKIK
jgi:hypothetical protein